MDVSDVFSNGFRLWKKNYKVGIIFFAGYIVSAIIFITVMAWIVLAVIGENTLLKLYTHAISQTLGNNSIIIKNLIKTEFFRVLPVVIILFVALFLIHSYFLFAGIRGCVLAMDGSLSFREAFKYALKRYPKFLLAEVLSAAIVLASTLPLIAGLLLKSKYVFIISLPLTLLAVIVTAFFLTYVNYAVADGYGAVESIFVSFRTVKSSPLNTLLIIIVVVIIGAACSTISSNISLTILKLHPSPSFSYFLIALLSYYMIFSILRSFFVMPLKAFFLLINMRHLDHTVSS
jgi:hypothetical protein